MSIHKLSRIFYVTTGGLAGMRERSRLLGGRLTIRSVLGAGTRLRVELPLKGDGRGAES